MQRHYSIIPTESGLYTADVVIIDARGAWLGTESARAGEIFAEYLTDDRGETIPAPPDWGSRRFGEDDRDTNE